MSSSRCDQRQFPPGQSRRGSGWWPCCSTAEIINTSVDRPNKHKSVSHLHAVMCFVPSDRRNPKQCVRVSASNQPEDGMCCDLCSKQWRLFLPEGKRRVVAAADVLNGALVPLGTCVSEDVRYILATLGTSLQKKKKKGGGGKY